MIGNKKTTKGREKKLAEKRAIVVNGEKLVKWLKKGGKFNLITIENEIMVNIKLSLDKSSGILTSFMKSTQDW